jgi:predicted TIM-barrel fold metal-dependent hydrolase
MPITWCLTDYDRDFFRRELESFVPDNVFDAHAHLYELSHWNSPETLKAGPATVSLETYREQIEWLTPGRKTTGLFFGVGFSELSRKISNEFVAREIGHDPRSRGLLVVCPQQDSEQVREEIQTLGMVGLKVYHTFSRRTPTWGSEINEFLTEEHVRAANEGGHVIMLHMVKARALADPANQRQIRFYCEQYPNIKMVLAHAARGLNPFHTIEGIGALRGLHNVWCDTSAVTEAGGFEAIIEVLGHKRLLWGSDYPISHFRGRCVSVGDEFLWLYEETLDWETVNPIGKIRPLLVGHESLRALKLAAMRLHLSDTQLEDIFFNNARAMLGM